MYLQSRLGWINGFPIDSVDGQVHWVQVPSDRHSVFNRVVLEREHL